ncbi:MULTISPECIES: fimbrial biogenesis chaperone [unclassified Cedecea]|uniref:fimbrial biogenesis chaperone n=1 Tax=unclassified Cedecea TaxID=2649846 RepID=UPI003015E897
MSITRLTTLLCTALFSINFAIASVQISSTRIIYDGKEKDVSIQVNNSGSYPVLLQSWVDDGNPDAKPENVRVPFFLTPPLTRVNSHAGQTLRLTFVGPNLPQDRESVYWLNILEIPPVTNKQENQIQVAFRSRIKIFYRPEALNAQAANEAGAEVRWSQQGSNIILSNPTPYYISAVSIGVEQNGKKFMIPADMLAPKGSAKFTLPQSVKLDASSAVSIEFINDYGAVVKKRLQNN